MIPIISAPAFLLLIDYDNLIKGVSSPLRLLDAWLDSIADTIPPEKLVTATLLIRLYGGWYDKSLVTESRMAAAIETQKNWPSVYRHKGHYCRFQYEFADHLAITQLVESDSGPVRILNTRVSKNSRPRVKKSEAMKTCTTPGCQAAPLYKWLSKGRGCTEPKCGLSFSQCFQPVEQKQVDTHMILDFISYAQAGPPYNGVSLFSDDQDVIPGCAYVAVRKHPTSRISLLRTGGAVSYMDVFLKDHDISIVNSL